MRTSCGLPDRAYDSLAAGPVLYLSMSLISSKVGHHLKSASKLSTRILSELGPVLLY